MLEFFKLDLKESLLKLEYICLQKNIPIFLIENLKLNSKFAQVILFKEDGEFKENAMVDSNGEIWISGVPAKDWNTKETMPTYDMLEETLRLIPFTKIDPETDLDAILDKINKWGMNSLLKEEFDFLYNY
jgi:hypothetical protein